MQNNHHQHYFQSEERYDAPAGAPPAYTSSASPAYYQAVSDSKHRHGKPILFPQQLVFTYRVGRSHSHLGEVKDQPLFLVRIPRWSMGWSDIVLLSGTDKLDAPLASAGVEKGSKTTRTALRVMPHRGSALQQPFEASMDGNYKSKHHFTIPVGADGHLETFEWRQSKGRMVKDLVGGFQFGLKLVRLQGPPAASSSSSAHSGSDADDMDGVTSDGRSVVAVFAGERWRYNNAKFRFSNEGSTGELGELFEIIAVMSFIRLFEMQMAQGSSIANSSSAAAASSSAAAAVV
ncbi:unnamed protein product [Clonostachys rosea]|uniref:NADH:ubiquinone oxidoreductase intermediate-associated protein 30 domain-containing protein n=1 Tax=Bionectria ochroleuca TaxID=29856 RepID=A0ABY6UZC4_BIOOC|nr:unnamed protein product [Clonostachys rosea]